MHDILSIFSVREKTAVKGIMQCMGFNLDQFNSGLDLYINTENDNEDSDIRVDAFRDHLERFLPLHKLSMFRIAVNIKKIGHSKIIDAWAVRRGASKTKF